MQIDYTPHVAQQVIHNARDARFRTVCTGRRFGKTMCMAAEILDRGGGEAGGDYGWVAPTYTVADRGIDAFRHIAPDFVRIVGRMPARAEFEGAAGACRVWFLSADNPDGIRGFGFQGLVVDEAAAIPVNVWNYVLRPTLAQTLGWGVFISTPAGRNWFYDMFTRGVERQPGFRSFTFPSNVSPYFPAQEWEEARRTLPEDVFRQEYMAEFLEDSAGVFRGIDACLFDAAVGSQHSAVGSDERIRTVVVGCDIAKHTDWTVCVAVDANTGRCLEMERFNQLDWPVQRERIAAFVKRWRARLVMDATGVGDPIFDDLCRVLPQVEGFKITGASKRELVQGLMVAVEQRRVSWPGGKVGSGSGQHAVGAGTANGANEGKSVGSGSGQSAVDGGSRLAGDWAVLTAEMKRYEYEIGPTGQVSYSAPSGYHDDCVMALALAVWGCARFGVEPGRMLRLGGGVASAGLATLRRTLTLA
jgi:hypothetical protein